MDDYTLLAYLLNTMKQIDFFKKYPSRKYLADDIKQKQPADLIAILLQDSCLWTEIAGKSGYMIEHDDRRQYLNDKFKAEQTFK